MVLFLITTVLLAKRVSYSSNLNHGTHRSLNVNQKSGGNEKEDDKYFPEEYTKNKRQTLLPSSSIRVSTLFLTVKSGMDPEKHDSTITGTLVTRIPEGGP